MTVGKTGEKTDRPPQNDSGNQQLVPGGANNVVTVAVTPGRVTESQNAQANATVTTKGITSVISRR